jgi:hypothetical protein
MQVNVARQQPLIASHISGTPGEQAPFRELEIQLLELAGLPETLAIKHVDNVLAAYGLTLLARWTVTYGLGGTVIVIANSIGTAC